MSALITIVSSNPELKLLLGLVIAKAIDDAGFTNAMAKTVMVREPLNGKEVPKKANILVDPTLPVKMPPELLNINFAIHGNQEEVIGDMKKRNNTLVDEHIVLSFMDDTSKKYEEKVREFLE